MNELNVETGHTYLMVTNRFGADVESRLVKVTSVEDRGDFYYIGYRPLNGFSNLSFGYAKVKKNGSYRAVNHRFQAA